MSHNERTSTLGNLEPPEVIRHLAHFLAPHDAVALSRTSRRLNTVLGLVCVKHDLFTTFHKHGDYSRGDWRYLGFRLPCLTSRSRRHVIHSMFLDFSWKDQGWGNRKGQVHIVGHNQDDFASISTAHHPDTPSDTPGYFGGGRVVYSSAAAPHGEQSLRICFNPRPDEVYCLWYNVGGGGGHQLILRHGVVRALIHDDEMRNYSRIYGRLVELGVVRTNNMGDTNRREAQSLFFPRMLIYVSRELRHQLQRHEASRLHLDDHNGLQNLFAEFSIPVTTESLHALEWIGEAQIEECRLSEQDQYHEQNQQDNTYHVGDRDDQHEHDFEEVQDDEFDESSDEEDEYDEFADSSHQDDDR